ncbi:MAG: hypothetical protein LBL28_05245, partial [Treponema sp.]|nr:hypothetical protein [Treponema sp.]
VPAPVNSLRLGAFFCKFATELALNNFAILHNPSVRDLSRTARPGGFRKFFENSALFALI